MSAVGVLSDLTWFDDFGTWAMKCRLSIDSPNPTLVPANSDWWITVDDSYPYGEIVLFPDAITGMRPTFAHQLYNGRRLEPLPWRSGQICVRTPQFLFSRHSFDPDPIGRTGRLIWYLQRAIEWLQAAASGTLVATGDPFELPDFPGLTSPRRFVVHGETDDSFRVWRASSDWYGTAEIVGIEPQRGHHFVVRRFFNSHRDQVLSYPWGQRIAASECSSPHAIWLRCESLPTTDPYEAIDDWGTLFDFLRKDGREGMFRDVLQLARDGQPHLLLIGFPIPRHVGRAVCQLHWQPVLLPTLSYGHQFRNGFRANRDGHWMRDKAKILASNVQLDWHKAENWSRAEVSSRGKLDPTLSTLTVLVIGVGAVGSAVAELLVRAGVKRVVLCDGDDIEHGNLCRHTSCLDDLGRNKAEAVAARLVGAHALADAQAIPECFPPEQESATALARECGLVIDCTGDDTTLHAIATFLWGSEKLFCSISLSFKALRAYVFTSHGSAFPFDSFHEQFARWAKQDNADFADEELSRLGIGCWHPAFPARVDDIWMLTAAAVRRLEEFVRDGDTSSSFVTFEQVLENGVFRGIRRS